MSDIEKRSVDENAPAIHERPTGLKGIYYNPYTQVQVLHSYFSFSVPELAVSELFLV